MAPEVRGVRHRAEGYQQVINITEKIKMNGWREVWANKRHEFLEAPIYDRVFVMVGEPLWHP